MLMTSAPQALNILLSALLENLGPSMVTMVPPSCTCCEEAAAALNSASLVLGQKDGHMGM